MFTSSINNTIIRNCLHSFAANSPPIISGNLTFFAEFGEEVTYTYKVEDPDGDKISSFILKVQNTFLCIASSEMLLVITVIGTKTTEGGAH